MEMESLYCAQVIRMAQLRALPDPLSADIIQRETEIRGKMLTAPSTVNLSDFPPCSMVDSLDTGSLVEC